MDIAAEDKGAIFMKMQGKPGIVKANLIAIPLLLLCVMFSNADCLQELYPLLTNVEGFNLTPKEASSTLSNAASIASIVTIPMLLLSGVIYDVVGRRKTIIMLLLLGAIATYAFPVAGTLESKLFFMFLRVVFQVSMVCITANPIINDYVITENRGKATAL